ncbi:MAG: CCA tRNA nucleotidyltransferase [Bdellovibrionales bacterium]
MPMNVINVTPPDWLMRGPVPDIFAALAARGCEARVVGGAVRDMLLGRAVKDIDLAVNVEPAQVCEIMREAGYKTVPTGIKFGTVLILAGQGQGYEITSLRRDIETDGRHAKVTYTRDWAEDAQRRDFTINALYMDGEGKIYDFVGGLLDIEQKKLRFIGAPEDRIQEDLLRILRYFRFIAELSFAEDEHALAACSSFAGQLSSLSSQRIREELMRLLMAPDAGRALRLIERERVFKTLLPEADQFSRFENLIKRFPESDFWVRFAALLSEITNNVKTRLGLSEKRLRMLENCLSLASCIENIKTPFELRQALYVEGEEVVRAGLALYEAEQGAPHSELWNVIELWENPVFPLQGRDMKACGLSSGPEIGYILREVKSWWQAGDLRASREACLKQAMDLMQAHRR